MKETICEEKLLEKANTKLVEEIKKSLGKYINLKKCKIECKTAPSFVFRDKTYIFIFISSNKVAFDKYAFINFSDKTIKVYDEKFYEPLKKFGEDNGYEEIIKCWNGVV